MSDSQANSKFGRKMEETCDVIIFNVVRLMSRSLCFSTKQMAVINLRTDEEAAAD